MTNIKIEYQAGRTGLIFATSPDLPGLLVAATTMDELAKRVPAAIRDLHSERENAPTNRDLPGFCRELPA